ncbi:MAG: hydroxymethylglutaryl-CoA synthase [Gammaproteobacteria bacterium]|nr:hydroxymethylglutaryl-CoA synthase [Gammaproteobacteria bacterium]NNF48763.1 hydroxymethylglutaryl-CoA synthase [Woeseiaceae bacterium]MBT8094608.1 hydroxymethylglutaryl-CoA synthase [Gammaproteobacteria bacterium]MBT8106373.1 hydroxymethylglutaryl-CoA synthase [Gammaproteobacteria bacterium]NNK26388.1 hydroxymethylglutaryl-CoA synthase [Woeseiaceae bacterium]
MKNPVSTRPIGISGLAAYIPPYRVWLEDWCDWTDSQWPKIREVVGRSFRVRGPQQSVYTMSANAVLRLIDQYDVDPTRVKFLGLGTESSTDNSAGAIIVKGMVDEALAKRGKPPISRSCEVPEFKHACLGGVYGMKGAIRHLALDGAGSQAIVVCADIAEYARGSSGEPTQGAGAVAMLLEEDPQLAVVDLVGSGSASDYRIMDFRKPMMRFCGQDRSESHHVQDFPVFNGKYSTTCYVDETLQALNDMYEKRRLEPSLYLRSLRSVFMHRPYRRMPETGWAVSYLFALGHGSAEDRAELASYCEKAGIDADLLVEEMGRKTEVSNLATPEQHSYEAYPLTMAAMRAFRAAPGYRKEILGKLRLGSDTMLDLGNLYTAALPAWMAAGFEQALVEGSFEAGEEVLTLGYGSGDAAEVIPFFIAEGWREATRKIGFAEAMESAIDLDFDQYVALHDGRHVKELEYEPSNEFIIDSVGTTDERHFSDLGIEYYKYIA